MHLFTAEIADKRRLASDIFRLRLTAGRDFLQACRPGRFVMLAPGDEQLDPLLRRPFGIVRWGDEWFEVVIRAVGKGSRALIGRPVGGRIAVHGPLGNGWPDDNDGYRSLILVAGGIGIAAVAACVFQCAGRKAVLLYGVARREELVLLDELRRAGGAGLTVKTITDDGSCGRRGLVTELLAEELERSPEAWVFACGPEAMLKGVQGILAERRVEGWLSLENRMACGFGVCLGCVQPLRPAGGGDGGRTRNAKVCTEGPVFPAGEVVFDG